MGVAEMDPVLRLVMGDELAQRGDGLVANQVAVVISERYPFSPGAQKWSGL